MAKGILFAMVVSVMLVKGLRVLEEMIALGSDE